MLSINNKIYNMRDSILKSDIVSFASDFETNHIIKINSLIWARYYSALPLMRNTILWISLIKMQRKTQFHTLYEDLAIVKHVSCFMSKPSELKWRKSTRNSYYSHIPNKMRQTKGSSYLFTNLRQKSNELAFFSVV